MIASALLIVAALAYFALQRATPLPTANDTTTTTTMSGTAYLVDVEGWYQITPHERAVTAKYDLRLSALPNSLPMQIGAWQGSTLKPSPDLDTWFDHPEVAIERQYLNAQGDVMWLAVFGSAGRKSFYLFEHTPQTCYPGSGWNSLRQDVDRIPLGNAAIFAQRGLAEKDGQRLLVLYWYIWDNLERDAQRGVLSFRLTAPILKDEAHTLRAMKEDFLAQIFERVLEWKRF
jgi:hypothetical protein